MILRIVLCILYAACVLATMYSIRKGTAARWKLRLASLFWPILFILVVFFVLTEALIGEVEDE